MKYIQCMYTFLVSCIEIVCVVNCVVYLNRLHLDFGDNFRAILEPVHKMLKVKKKDGGGKQNLNKEAIFAGSLKVEAS